MEQNVRKVSREFKIIEFPSFSYKSVIDYNPTLTMENSTKSQPKPQHNHR